MRHCFSYIVDSPFAQPSTVESESELLPAEEHNLLIGDLGTGEDIRGLGRDKSPILWNWRHHVVFPKPPMPTSAAFN